MALNSKKTFWMIDFENVKMGVDKIPLFDWSIVGMINK